MIQRREKYYRRLIRGEFPSPAIEEIISNVFIVDHRSEEKNVMHRRLALCDNYG